MLYHSGAACETELTPDGSKGEALRRGILPEGRAGLREQTREAPRDGRHQEAVIPRAEGQERDKGHRRPTQGGAVWSN